MASTVDLLNAEWRYLAFLNYEIEAGVLERYLPDGLELDTYNGRHYLSLVGLMFLNARIAGVDDPIHSEFEQINLRFYVKRPDPAGGYRHGVVFLREIVPDALPTVGARVLYNERYVQMPTRHAISIPSDEPEGIGSFEYAWATGEGDGQRWHHMLVATHGRTKHPQMGSKEEFLTQRPWGYSGSRGMTTLEYQVEHPLWRIWPATRATLECDVKEVFGRELVPYMSGAPALAFVAAGSDVTSHLPKAIEKRNAKSDDRGSKESGAFWTPGV
jgi:uncharacterized protein YqjF (DUF2071 family)